MTILLLNKQYLYLLFKAHTDSCMPNVCDNNMYEAQTCASFYYLVPVVLISVQDDGAVEVLRKMNYLSQEGL